ncbi:MAG: NAD(P)H-dependent oxidoreductase [Granulosicoccus sp.]|nr:NAD(P)H-dependent oxidoreductase [Granulosicoccus sp.]
MSKVIVFYIHPGQPYSSNNRALQASLDSVSGIERVDLYAQYPRFNIDIPVEQDRLLRNDFFIFQFPIFWYSCPSLLKEWLDLVLEYGFAYGDGGDRLKGKKMMLSLTTGGHRDAYSAGGHQGHPLPSFLLPFQQTANLCNMQYFPPYVLFDALQAQPSVVQQHATGYARLVESLRDNTFDEEAAAHLAMIHSEDLPTLIGTRR